ncbi:hypothetical protein CA13_06110 [Planctomycetes bacterium CA13]|uniref:Uncharacterized protein n=1 Tax=Novipirellula herctigrandis TaxID=2527986 RepID=A0A5C5YXD6_9BACT|nr:hypothetical protein CA13_06110 [Planctomycetes bacterium CA13]
MRSLETKRHISFLRMLTLPHVGVLVGVVLSFGVWMLPAVSTAGKGFVAAPTSFYETSLTLLAYGAIVASCAVGYFLGIPLGRRLPVSRVQERAGLEMTGVWTAWIALATLGVGLAMLKIVGALGVGGCIQAITSFNANGLKKVLYEDYSLGLLSLRYVAILVGGIAIFRYLAFREVSMRTIVSLCLTLAIAMISSRLSLIWAVVIGGCTYLLAPSSIEKRKISLAEVAVWGGIFMFVIGALTISRTYGYYQKRGAETFVAAASGEFNRYLAAPFQGSIEAVNSPSTSGRMPDTAGIDNGLTTNSALMEVAVWAGKWNVVALSVILFLSGVACGMLHYFRGTYVIVMYGVFQCCNLEVWRIVMFDKGITLTLLFVALAVPFTLTFLRLPAIQIPTLKLRLR